MEAVRRVLPRGLKAWVCQNKCVCRFELNSFGFGAFFLYLKLYKCYLILSSVHFLCCFIIFVLYQFISGEGKMSEKDVYLQETKAITYGFL